MARGTVSAVALLGAWACSAAAAPVHANPDQEYDIIVYGATPAGIGAAVIAAQRGGARVALLEVSPLVGGMAGPGGIGLRDIAEANSVANSTVIREWLRLNSAAYNVSSTVWQPDEYIGQANWWKVLNTPGLDVFVNTGISEAPGAISKSGTTITSLSTVYTVSDDPTNTTTWHASVFVDASYEADLVLASNANYTYGRESRSQYNESLAGVLPTDSFTQFQHPVDPYWPNGTLLWGVDAGPSPPLGTGDDRVMPYSYRLCVTPDTSNQVAWPEPAGYDPTHFELLIRYAISLGGAPVSAFVSELDYNGYPTAAGRSMRYDLCESGDSAVSTDEPSAIYDTYITGNRAARAAVAAQVKYFVSGMMYTLATHPRVPAGTRNSTAKWGLCKDAWPANGNWPPLLYVREGVRIVGDFVTTQNNLIKGVCVPNSIGLGAWTIDVHIMNRVVGTIGGNLSARNEGEVGFAPLPGSGNVYEMPYSLLLPKRSDVTNLLVPVCPSASHIAFASIRVEPTFMQLGTAAGIAASIAFKSQVAVQDVSMPDLQAGIVAAGQCVHWPNCTGVGQC